MGQGLNLSREVARITPARIRRPGSSPHEKAAADQEPVKPVADRAEPHLVGTDLDLTGTAARCPSCNAALRTDALWCSLCHHDLRPAPAPVAIPSPSPSPYAGPDPLTAPLLDVVLPPVPSTAAAGVPDVPVVPTTAAPAVPEPAGATWPCTACGARNAFELDACGECGSRFLALASDGPSLVVPGVGDLQQLSRGHRAAVAAGFLALVLVPLALITFLLTDAPKKDAPSGNDVTVSTVP